MICLLLTTVSPAKTAEPIEMPFSVQARIGSKIPLSGSVREGATWGIFGILKGDYSPDITSVTPRTLPPTGGCHIKFYPVKNAPGKKSKRPYAMWPVLKLLWVILLHLLLLLLLLLLPMLSPLQSCNMCLARNFTSSGK